jgi:hypothetical protein
MGVWIAPVVPGLWRYDDYLVTGIFALIAVIQAENQMPLDSFGIHRD